MKYGPWEIHNGGPCPLKEGERAQVQLDCESREQIKDEGEAELFKVNHWNVLPDGLNIVAFRRVIEPKTVTRKLHVSELPSGYICDGHVSGGKQNFTITITGDTIKAEWVE